MITITLKPYNKPTVVFGRRVQSELLRDKSASAVFGKEVDHKLRSTAATQIVIRSRKINPIAIKAMAHEFTLVNENQATLLGV